MSPLASVQGVRAVLLGLILLAPLPFGCVEDWSRWLLLLLIGLVFCRYLTLGSPLPTGARERAAFACVAAFLIWLGIQLLPLSPGVLRVVSPEGHRLYGIAVPGYEGSDPMGYAAPVSPPDPLSTFRTISLNPHATWRILWQTACLAAFVLMGLGILRLEDSRRSLALTLVVVGVVQACYGAAEMLTGRQHIFLYAKRFYADVATGTLINRNHFAGMLNMILPVAVALLIARRSRTLVQRGLLVASMAMGLGVILSRSRMGIASMVVGLMILAVGVWRERRRSSEVRAPTRRRSKIAVRAIPGLLLVGVLATAVLALDGFGAASRFLRIRGDLSEGAARPALWAEAVRTLSRFPITGAGAGAFSTAVNTQLSTLPLPSVRRYDHAHNDYLEAAVTLGPAGLLFGGAAVLLLVLRRPRDTLSMGAMAGLTTLAVHSFTDFLLVVPSNALMACALICLAAGRHDDREPEAARSTPRVRVAAVLVVLILLLAWPARSLVAAVVFRPHQESPLTRSETVDALELAAVLDPGNDLYPRRLAESSVQRLREEPPGVVMLGEDLREQVARNRRERLGRMREGHTLLMRCLDQRPIDYSLHAEIARVVTGMRQLARDAGLKVDGDGMQRGPLAAPHRASRALAPTAWENRAAMAALLWSERSVLDDATVDSALRDAAEAIGKPHVEVDWAEYFIDVTGDGPSLDRIDRLLKPPPLPYARRLARDLRQTAARIRPCLVTLRTLAELREARGSERKQKIERLKGLQPLLDPSECGDAGARLRSLVGPAGFEPATF